MIFLRLLLTLPILLASCVTPEEHAPDRVARGAESAARRVEREAEWARRREDSARRTAATKARMKAEAAAEVAEEVEAKREGRKGVVAHAFHAARVNARSQVRAIVDAGAYSEEELREIAVSLCEGKDVRDHFLVMFFDSPLCLEGWNGEGTMRESDMPHWIARVSVDRDVSSWKLYARTFQVGRDMETGMERTDALRVARREEVRQLNEAYEVEWAEKRAKYLAEKDETERRERKGGQAKKILGRSIIAALHSAYPDGLQMKDRDVPLVVDRISFKDGKVTLVEKVGGTLTTEMELEFVAPYESAEEGIEDIFAFMLRGTAEGWGDERNPAVFGHGDDGHFFLFIQQSKRFSKTWRSEKPLEIVEGVNDQSFWAKRFEELLDIETD